MTAPDDMPDHIWAQAHTGTDCQGRWSVVDLNVYAPASEYVRADVVDELAQALEGMVAAEVDLAASGDAGYYDPEIVPEVIAARAALARYRGGA